MTFIKKIKRGKYVYLAEVKSVREGDKVKHKFIRYVGKEVDGKKILSGSIVNARIDKVAIYGPLLILDAMAKKINLSKLLGEYGDYLLSLAYAHCISPNSVKKLTKWFERTDINSLLNIKDVTYKKLLEALDSIEGENGAWIQNKIFTAIKQEFKLKPKGYFYDVTNAYFYGIKCPIAKKKKKPKSKNQPQIEIGLAITKDEGIPIFHKVFEGNVFDARTLRDVLTSLQEHDVKESFIIWDRGVTSKINIADAKKVGFQVLCGLPLKGKIKEIAKNIITKKYLCTIKNRVRLKNATFYAEKLNYKYGGIDGCIVICLNEKEKQDIKERRYDEIDKALELLSKNKPIKEGIQKYIKGKSINHSLIEKSEIFDGVSAIFCTKNLKQNEIIKAYFEKDKIEKAFRILKGLLEMDKIRFWLTDKVKAHIFICYLSYLLLSLADYKLRKINVGSINALELLEPMYKVFITDPQTKNIFTKTVTLTKKQEQILKAIDPKLLKCSQ